MEEKIVEKWLVVWGVNAFNVYKNFNKINTNKISIEMTNETHEFACTQNSHTMMGRSIVKETNLTII